MAPNLTGPATGLFLAETEVVPKKTSTFPEKKQQEYEWKLVWRNILAFVYLHLGAIYGIYLIFAEAKFQTVLCFIILIHMGGLGVTAGSHRLWSHKAYKAKWPLRLLLAIFQTLAFQNHIYEWVRDHRVHHKFTDTDADPHNSRRGFFFSHMGWLVVKKHRDVMNKGKTVDMTDLERDWVVMLQKRTYAITLPLFCFILPTWIPVYFWNEKAWTAWYVTAIARYTLSLHGTWLVNSAAHMFGMRPYDKAISPTENVTVSIFALGEGFHNYHHAFPWDYRTSEFSSYTYNFTTAFIDLCARLGLAYNLKTANIDMIRKRALRTGDGGHHWVKEQKEKEQTNEQTIEKTNDNEHTHEGEVWGWGDKDMTEEDKKMVIVLDEVDDKED